MPHMLKYIEAKPPLLPNRADKYLGRSAPVLLVITHLVHTIQALTYSCLIGHPMQHRIGIDRELLFGWLLSGTAHKNSLAAAVCMAIRAGCIITLHSLLHLRLSNAAARVAATNAVCVFVTCTASPVKAVFSLQLESQDVGKSQAVTVSREGLQKEPSALQGSKHFRSWAMTAKVPEFHINATAPS